MSVNTKKLAARMQAVKNSASVLTKLAYSASIPVQYIHPSDDNLCARQDTDESIADLAASIDANGLLHPLAVNKVSETEYRIISGERRFRAITTHLHWDAVDCRVFEHIDGPKSFLMLLSANLAVREYSAGEKLSFYKAAVAALSQMDVPATQKDLAKVLGVSDRQVKKYKAISSLSEEDQEAIQNGTLSINEAYAKATGKGEPVPLASVAPEGEPVPLASAAPKGEPVPLVPAAPEGEPVPLASAAPKGEPVPLASAASEGEPVPLAPAEPEGEPVPLAPAEPEGEPVPLAPAEPEGEPVPLAPAAPEGEPVPLTPAASEGEPVPFPYCIDTFPVAQIQLPDPADADPHPRLQFDGNGIHAGDSFTAWLPDGWHEITLEINWNAAGPNCWVISDPALRNVCPIGLWCRV